MSSSPISFYTDNDQVLFFYSPESGTDYIYSRLNVSEPNKNDDVNPEFEKNAIDENLEDPSGENVLRVKHVYYFTRDELLDDRSNDNECVFVFAKSGTDTFKDYFIIPKNRFGIEQDVLISKNIKFSIRLFSAGYERRTSVMASISKVISDDQKMIIIGGDVLDSIPDEVFFELLDSFPTTTSLKHYGERIIDSYIQDYLEPKKDFSSYNGLPTRSRKIKNTNLPTLIGTEFDTPRLDSAKIALEKLKYLLNSDKTPIEGEWQREIISILPVLFPQYICVFPATEIKDVLNTTNRQLDFLLVDASGNVDILEIKTSFEKRYLIMKRTYRNNYIPARELSGGIFQIEKYIHYLHNWGPSGEKTLTERFRNELPEDLSIRFLNPKGMLLIGHCHFTEKEKRDFDLIRRQYAHIADIITYDDLIDRFERIIDSIESVNNSDN